MLCSGKAMNKILNKFLFKLNTSYKINKVKTSLIAIFSPQEKTVPIFIFGCQRSGTTITMKIIGVNPNIKMYGEGDRPYFVIKDNDFSNMLKPLDEIKDLFTKEKNKYTLLKPLSNSQDLTKIMLSFPECKSIWVYRNYLDTILSHINSYTDEHFNFYKNKIINFNTEHWINQNMKHNIQEIISKVGINNLDKKNLYAIYWLMRNKLLIEYVNQNNILIVNYDALLEKPGKNIQLIYKYLDLECPKYIYSMIKSNKMKKVDLELHPYINEQCIELQNILDSTFLNQNYYKNISGNEV